MRPQRYRCPSVYRASLVVVLAIILLACACKRSDTAESTGDEEQADQRAPGTQPEEANEQASEQRAAPDEGVESPDEAQQASEEELTRDDADEPQTVLEELGATRTEATRGDYSRLRSRQADAWELSARSISDVQRAVRAAGRGDIVVRMRGRGHSMNGHSVPRNDELQLKTELLRSLCRVAEDEVRIGAGVAMVHADRFLSDYGLRLRVRNDGPPGPSVGGYISAGGFGGNSRTHGGLWSQVTSVQLVDGSGSLHTFTPEDEQFGYLFGSVGQLGAIVGATMRVSEFERTPAPETPLEIGECRQVPLHEHERNDGYFPIHYWWTFMVASERVDEARTQLSEIKSRHRDDIHFLPDYTYPIPHFGVHAPIVSPVADDIAALGIWVRVDEDEVEALRPVVEALEREVAALATDAGYRRYLSAELTTGPEAWRENLGAETYAAFGALKERLDPDHIFGRGQVFAYSSAGAN